MRIKTRLNVLAGPVDIVPLVNVMFLLLVFFLISSSVVFWPGTRVDTEVTLPTSRAHSMVPADKLVITITRSNLLFFNDRPVDWENLELQLHDLVHNTRLASGKRGTAPTEAGGGATPTGAPATGAGSGDGEPAALRVPLVVLRADQWVPYGRIVQVMSLARSLGLGVYLVTEPEKPGRGRERPLQGVETD